MIYTMLGTILLVPDEDLGMVYCPFASDNLTYYQSWEDT